jgi:hypothetical protein
LLLVLAELASALGDVEHDRGRSAVELVLEVSPAGRHRLVDLVDAVEQVQGAVVDIQLGVVERHTGRIGSEVAPEDRLNLLRIAHLRRALAT